MDAHSHHHHRHALSPPTRRSLRRAKMEPTMRYSTLQRRVCGILAAALASVFAPLASAQEEGARILERERVRLGPSGRDFWFDVPEHAVHGAERGDIYWMRPRALTPANAEGWTMVYVSEGSSGALVHVSGEIYLPRRRAAKPLPVALWNHPTAGMSDACGPSWAGNPAQVSQFGFERVPAIEALLAQGYAVVMSDYQGLGTPGMAAYMDGALAAKASLDAVRAVRNFQRARVSADFVAYGHSQGGQTSLWVAALGPHYAPELNLRGALAIAPAVDTMALTEWDIEHPPLGAYVITTVAGLSVARPHLRLRDILTPAGLELLATMPDLCYSTRAAAESVTEPLVRLEGLRPGSPWANAMAENGDVYAYRPRAPILILQGGQDFDVPAHITRDVVRRLRDAGSTVEYVEAEELDHFSIVPWSRERILNWFAQRRSELGNGVG